jgi:2',3'-cyclic-nucleotide 2'-phosphodiesterase/3'-nucleotidase
MKIKSSISYLIVILAVCLLPSCKKAEHLSISIVETTDLHGAILPWDYVEGRSLNASLAGTASYLKQLRNEKDAVILLDNGDNLQGQPIVYYYNFIDTISPHIFSEAMNWLGCDACTVGNHDIEAGHSVYDRLAKEYRFPLLAANAVDIKTGEPYFKPYTIIEKEKIRIAVLGLITPAIPTWLPEKLYSGISFTDMVETAEKWMPEILKQNPDVVVGLFHSGWYTGNDEYKLDNQLNENGTAEVAWKVPGFDIIFCGHDHRAANEKFVNIKGDTVLILNGGSRSEYVACADLKLTSKRINGGKLKPQDKAVREYVERVIGNSPEEITSRDSYFGPSSFTDMIHKIQMEITGADISFAAPLSFDVEISRGPVRVGDMFKLYRYENMLYTMSLTGEEVQNYLEYSYSGWVNTMKGPGDYMLKYQLDSHDRPVINNGRARLENTYYNFDSGAGINYTVDLSKPEGSRINIFSFTDGRPFEKNKSYKVAVNSYRGNGGGGLLTRGAGLRQEDLRSRLISSTDRDLRYYILRSVEENKILDPVPLDNWKFIPEKWVKERVPKEYLLLFGTTR